MRQRKEAKLRVFPDDPYPTKFDYTHFDTNLTGEVTINPADILTESWFAVRVDGEYSLRTLALNREAASKLWNALDDWLRDSDLG